MMLSPKQLNDICLLGLTVEPWQCPYLCQMQDGNYVCGLHSATVKRDIHPRAQGNCKGYPLLKYLIQGYDIDGGV